MAVSGMGMKDANILLFQKARTDWWLNKINGNIANDTKAIKTLKIEGWKIINLWECNFLNREHTKPLQTVLKKTSLTSF